MPVHSLPVPEVVGHAMCGLREPGMGCVQIYGLRRVHCRAAADGDVTIKTAVFCEFDGSVERPIRGFNRNIVVLFEGQAGAAE
jgi:hypothetical protein